MLGHTFSVLLGSTTGLLKLRIPSDLPNHSTLDHVASELSKRTLIFQCSPLCRMQLGTAPPPLVLSCLRPNLLAVVMSHRYLITSVTYTSAPDSIV